MIGNGTVAMKATAVPWFLMPVRARDAPDPADADYLHGHRGLAIWRPDKACVMSMGRVPPIHGPLASSSRWEI